MIVGFIVVKRCLDYGELPCRLVAVSKINNAKQVNRLCWHGNCNLSFFKLSNRLLMGISLWFHKIIGYFCEIKSKSIKKTAKILGFSLAGIVLFFALLYMLLQNSNVQQVVARAVVKELAAKLHTKVSVGKVEYKLFNVLSINDLYVEDQQKDTLLFVHEADAHFDFWKFFRNKIIFTSVDIHQLHGNLVVDKNGHSNLDFVIKAFQKPPKQDTTLVEYRIKHFRLHELSLIHI
jgi:hypothetical protein